MSVRPNTAPHGDEDKFGYYASQKQACKVERRHLQMQMERVRQQQLAKERKRLAEVAAKAQKLKKDWHVQDVLQRQAVQTESTIGTSDQQWRASTDLVRKAEERVQHETELAMHLANREIADAVYRAHDAELARLGTEKWARGMQTGAQEFALERAGWTISERKSLRDFGWVKADIRQEERLRRATQELLPTGPGALSHQQTPGAWRPDQLSMSPGAWASMPVQVTVERAQTAQMHLHGRNMRALIQRRELREKTLDKWDQVGTKVADTQYEAWRIKVNTAKSPRTPGWPHMSTHRVSSLYATSSAPTTPRGSPEPIFKPKGSPAKSVYEEPS